MCSYPTEKHSSLRILFWNANSLNNKITEFRNYLQDSTVDVALVQETMFRPKVRYNVANYTLYRTDRSDAINSGQGINGGTAIYVHDSIAHYVPTDLATSELESTSIIVLPERNHKILITSAYVRVSKPFPTNDFNNIFSYSNSVVAAGDMNARHRAWNCTSQNPRGTSLLKFLNDNPSINLHHPKTHTHTSKGSPSTIDLALIQNIPYNSNIETLDLFDSDHLPVLLTIDRTVEAQKFPPMTYTNWNNYHNTLAHSKLYYPHINNIPSLEKAVENITSCITEAQAANTTVINKPKVHTLPTKIKNLIRKRNAARKLYQYMRTPITKKDYHELRQTVRNEIRSFRQDQWTNFISNLSTEDNSIWHFQKRLKNNGIKNFPPIKGKNGYAFDPRDKAEAIADCYVEQFSPNNFGDPAHDIHVDQTVRHFINTPSTFSIPPTNIAEMKAIIKNLKPKKSPGLDNISNKCLKFISPNILIYLSAIINGVLKLKHFPSQWKKSIVCPIPKQGGSPSDPANYRPISLLSCLSKVAERVIHNRLQHFVDSNNIIIPEQFGFRAQHNTTQQLLRVVELASEGLQHGQPTAAIFLDIAKAFDKVSHTGLIYKLIQLKVPDTIIHLLHNYLSDRLFTVRIQNNFSSFKSITAGVLQGSILAPLMYSLYTNDIPRTDLTTLALYADDTAILATDPHLNSTAKFIQHHLDALETWCNNWKIKINPTKSQAICFTRSYKTPPRLYLHNQAIDWGDTAKYLGVTLDKRLTWRTHIINTKNKVIAKTNQIEMLLYSRDLSLHNKTLLYKTIVLPTALYACPIWSYAAKTWMDTIQRFQNRVLRRLSHSHRYITNENIRRSLNIDQFKNTCQRISVSFYDKLDNLNNEILAELPDYDFRDSHYCKRPRAAMCDRM